MAVICSICQFLSCICSHHDPFQATSMISANVELCRDEKWHNITCHHTDTIDVNSNPKNTDDNRMWKNN